MLSEHNVVKGDDGCARWPFGCVDADCGLQAPLLFQLCLADFIASVLLFYSSIMQLVGGSAFFDTYRSCQFTIYFVFVSIVICLPLLHEHQAHPGSLSTKTFAWLRVDLLYVVVTLVMVTQIYNKHHTTVDAVNWRSWSLASINCYNFCHCNWQTSFSA